MTCHITQLRLGYRKPRTIQLIVLACLTSASKLVMLFFVTARLYPNCHSFDEYLVRALRVSPSPWSNRIARWKIRNL